jgi:hypothetical protein
VPLTAQDFDRIVGKLQMRDRSGKHKFVFLEHDGKQIVWTARSHGRGDLGAVEYAIRRQLKVNGQQLKDLANCPMTRDAYIAHLKAKGLIE